MKALFLVVVLLASACSAGSSTSDTESPTSAPSTQSPTVDAVPTELPESDAADIERFDVAGDNDLVTPFAERAPVPDGAVPVYVVRSYADAAAFDELLAQAEATARSDQVIVTVDLSGCILLTLWALPEPRIVRVGYEFDTAVACAEAIDYRALFIVDDTGTSQAGDWDYTMATPDVLLVRQSRR